MNIGNKLLELRKQNKMTQEKLAEELNVTRQTISNWELGSTKPDLEQIKLISKLYQISIDNLLENDVKDILTSTISNTEKLTGLVYKILKFLVILFVGFFIFTMAITILGFIFFGVRNVNNISLTSVETEANLVCTLDDNTYRIRIWESKAEGEEPNRVFTADTELLERLALWDYETFEEVQNAVTNYFQVNGGSCY